MKTENKILIIFTAVSILIVIFFWFRYSKLVSQDQSNTASVIPRTSPSQKKDWVLFKNELFELTYPPELSFKYDNIQKNGDGYAGSVLIQNFDTYKRVPTNPTTFQIAIFVEPDSGKTLEELAAGEKTKKTKKVTIDGSDGLRGTSAKPSGDSPTVWMSKDGLLYTFQLSMPGSTNAGWFDEIIATFKFI